MVFAALLGVPLGASLGIAAGHFVFGKLIARPAQPFLKQCDQSADNDPDIPYPATEDKPVSFFKQMLLRDTTPALVMPDYERALFINKILQMLWPHLSPAIHKEVMKQAKEPIDEALASTGGLVQTIRIDRLDLGERPFRVDSFKTYQTMEDEIIMETPVFWGGDMSVRATAVIKAGPLGTVDVPLDIANIMIKAQARVTIKPLVETLPCVGGVTISLLEEPAVDMDLCIADSPDLLALPGVPLAVRAALKVVVGKMLVYPNELVVPLMEGFGLPPPPVGMLHVKVVAGHNLRSSMWDKVDPFVVLEVREGRSVQTATKQNDTDPTWNEDLDMVVDDAAKQHLKVLVMDDDLVSASVVGGALVELSGAKFVSNPFVPVTMRLPLYEPGQEGDLPVADAADLAAAVATAKTDAAVAEAVAAVPKRRGLIGRLVHKKQAKRAAAAAAEHSVTEGPTSPRAGSSEGSKEDEGEASLERRPRPPPGSVVGSVTMEVTFFPFKQALAEDAAAAGGAASSSASAVKDGEAQGKAPTPTAITSVRRCLREQSFTEASLRQKGVLTINLKKVMNLESASDSYVVARLYDPHRLPVPDVEFKSKVELNERSPRFNFKADFVNVSAASVLTLTVYHQPGAFASVSSLKVPFLQKAEAKVLGKVRLPLDDVVREGHIWDVYPLEEADTGEMHLILDWASIDLGARAERAAEAASGLPPAKGRAAVTGKEALAVVEEAEADVEAEAPAAGGVTGASGL